MALYANGIVHVDDSSQKEILSEEGESSCPSSLLKFHAYWNIREERRKGKIFLKIEKVYWADEYSSLGTPLNSAYSEISAWSEYINFMQVLC